MNVALRGGKTILVGLVIAAFLGGCASPTSEDDFGNSVRRMIEAQKYIPPEQAERRLPVLDGQKAEASIEQYRKDVGNPDRINQGMGYGPALTSQP
jgi:hypothetical protein